MLPTFLFIRLDYIKLDSVLVDDVLQETDLLLVKISVHI